jgi:hypothetical protein
VEIAQDRSRGRRTLPRWTAEREAAYATRWAAGEWCGERLRTASGAMLTLLYQGRSGGGAGPDFRDAVLLRADGTRLYGDIELHRRAADWQTHGHEHDPRYAGVALHVVFTPLPPASSGLTALPRQGTAPIVVLAPEHAPAAASGRGAVSWPCVGFAHRLRPPALRDLLVQAGNARLEARAASLGATLRAFSRLASPSRGDWPARDRLLWLELAEALGYGRDRELMRRAGDWVLAGRPPTVSPAGHWPLPRLELTRARALLTLHDRWQATGPWLPLRQALLREPARAAVQALTRELTVAGGALSPGRAHILVVNVVLPFALALAARERRSAPLATRARAVYATMPGLPSNQITRLMARQLGLTRLPAGAAAQQGLQQLWAGWCREKRCTDCPCALSQSAQPSTDACRNLLH